MKAMIAARRYDGCVSSDSAYRVSTYQGRATGQIVLRTKDTPAPISPRKVFGVKNRGKSPDRGEASARASAGVSSAAVSEWGIRVRRTRAGRRGIIHHEGHEEETTGSRSPEENSG